VDFVVTGFAWLSCVAAGFAAVVVAPGNWMSLCQDGTFERCLNGHPSFELVFQVALAAAGFAATLVMWRFVRRRRYAWAGAALAAALLLFAGWAVFLDAATHGWDDLKLLWLGATGPFH
jgi:hypothetical protein